MVRSPRFQDSATSIGQVISDSDDTLAALLRHAASLAKLESVLADYTGPDMAEQFRVAAVRGDRLVLQTPTASWATRLRMQNEQMLRFLKASGYEDLHHIDIHVAPLQYNRPLEKKTRRQLSPAAKLALQLMSRLSGNFSDDSNP